MMIKHIRLRGLLLLLTLWLALPLCYADAQTAYDVEIIVFEQSQSISQNNEEHWPKHPGLPDTSRAVTLADDTIEAIDETSLMPHIVTNQTLNNIETALDKAGTYRILTHLAWRQVPGSAQESPLVHVTGGKTYTTNTPSNPVVHELDGTVRLSKSRYPHFAIDLLLRAETTLSERNRRPFSRHAKAQPYATDVEWFLSEPIVELKPRLPTYQMYRLQQSLRLNEDKIYYIDHPKLGLFVQIKKAIEKERIPSQIHLLNN